MLKDYKGIPSHQQNLSFQENILERTTFFTILVEQELPHMMCCIAIINTINILTMNMVKRIGPAISPVETLCLIHSTKPLRSVVPSLCLYLTCHDSEL